MPEGLLQECCVSVSPGTENSRKLFVLCRSLILATLLSLSLGGPAWPHGSGGGGSHSGSFGHAGGSRASNGHRGGGAIHNSPGLHHRAHFSSVFPFFDHFHDRSAFRIC